LKQALVLQMVEQRLKKERKLERQHLMVEEEKTRVKERFLF
jgi:hypothetical protein